MYRYSKEFRVTGSLTVDSFREVGFRVRQVDQILGVL